MHKKFGTWLAVAATVLMTACGGGGSDSGNSGFGGGSSSTTAADLVLTLSSPTLQNTGSDTVTATATVVDANRNAISGASVVFAVDNNAVATSGGGTTDSTGKSTATIGVGSDRSNRVVTVKATVGSIERSVTLLVTGTVITATYTPNVSPGVEEKVYYKLTDKNSNALVGQTITISAPGLAGATGSTSASGEYTFVYTAPATQGTLTITATAAGVSTASTVQVQATSSVPNAIGPISSASISANPKVVPVNTDSTTTNQSEIRVLFVGASNKPIENVRVRFALPDPNSIGGQTQPAAGTVLYSNSSGIVTSAYLSGSRSSPTDGVTVRACWDTADFAASACPNFVDVKLTVTAEPLSVTVGTNGEIAKGDDGLTYVRDYVVMVVNSAGFAMSNVAVSASLDLPTYHKGQWILGAESWVKVQTISCTNEDINRNGVLDAGEDLNSSGEIEPRKADAALQYVTSTTTNSSGMVILRLVYPQNKASWFDYKITVSANGVAGTEGTATYSATTSVPADVVKDIGATPAFRLSPYGQSSSCASAN